MEEEPGDGVKDRERRVVEYKGGDGPKIKMRLKYCEGGGVVYVLGIYKCHVRT